MKSEEITMEKFKYILRNVISKEIFDDFENETVRNFFTDQIIHTIRVSLYGNEIDKPYKHPLTWIDALIETFPKWLKKFLRVRYKTITFRVLYPGFKAFIEPYIIKIEISEDEAESEEDKSENEERED